MPVVPAVPIITTMPMVPARPLVTARTPIATGLVRATSPLVTARPFMTSRSSRVRGQNECKQQCQQANNIVNKAFHAIDPLFVNVSFSFVSARDFANPSCPVLDVCAGKPFTRMPENFSRSGFITPSDPRWRCCRPLEMLTYCRVCCAFESACALPSGVIRGCETTYRQ
jgi:hypothetical protein